MFYPAAGHGIEDEYIKPVLKNLKKAPSFIATSQTQAFCCSKSIEELETLNHTGALNWIRSFENQMDKTNKKPLPVALHRANMFWYEMSTKIWQILSSILISTKVCLLPCLINALF